MKQTRPGCQLVAPSASQWDGKAFVLGGNLRSALCAAQAFLCTCKHVCCWGTEEANTQMYNLHLKKKKSVIFFTEISFLLCVRHRTLSASLNGRDVKEKKNLYVSQNSTRLYWSSFVSLLVYSVLINTVGGALMRILNSLEVVSILSHSPVKYHNLDSTNSLTPI